jgi:hypothetical protein
MGTLSAPPLLKTISGFHCAINDRPRKKAPTIMSGLKKGSERPRMLVKGTRSLRKKSASSVLSEHMKCASVPGYSASIALHTATEGAMWPMDPPPTKRMRMGVVYWREKERRRRKIKKLRIKYQERSKEKFYNEKLKCS